MGALRFWSVLVAVVGVALPVREAHAESPPLPCYASGMSPSSMTVPANIPAFALDAYVSGLGGDIDAGDEGGLVLERLEGTDMVPVASDRERIATSGTDARLVLRPLAPLSEGFVHELRWDGCPVIGRYAQRYSVGPAIPLPEGPGALRAHTEAVARDGVLVRFEWVVELTVSRGDLGAWGDALEHTLRLPAGGRADAPEGSSVAFRVELACEDYPGMRPGDHATHAMVRDLGRTTLVQAEMALTASCAAPVFVDESTGAPLTDEEIRGLRRVVLDAGLIFDAGLDASDAGASFDGGTSAAAGGCTASPGRGTGSAALVLLVLLALAPRARTLGR